MGVSLDFLCCIPWSSPSAHQLLFYDKSGSTIAEAMELTRGSVCTAPGGEGIWILNYSVKYLVYLLNTKGVLLILTEKVYIFDNPVVEN